MDIAERFEWMQKISAVFTPSAPIDQKALFSGRIEQFNEVLTAVSQRGQHVIVFGERGVGKTSLATVISRVFGGKATNRLSSGTINCDPTTTFSSLWHKVFREVPVPNPAPGGGLIAAESKIGSANLAQFLPDVVTPDDVRHLLQRMPRIVIVIDELDRIQDRETTTLLADTIKNLSDHAVESTLILVGVADSVDSLITEHQSVERALVQVRMPRMDVTEIREIIDKGLSTLGMTMDEIAREKIAVLSQGLPHYTHLLCLNALLSAVDRGSKHAETIDVTSAIEKAHKGAQLSIINAYHKATTSSRENLYPQVLLACALANRDSLNYFAAADVRDPMSRIMRRSYDIPAYSQHLNALCEAARGPILQRTGTTRKFRFRFVNPLMQPYVVMEGVKKGYIKEEDLIAVNAR
ncbi:AAA family ATPase [Burkholderia cepacia]|uniref:nSTAND1 domain-containing NTPase n=1 Tax=Burkholderia cepacia TaxID=292 RepID=UPI002019D995|nr:ATP-binding protein [Burkholderia cepacia]UQO35932.1 ATP-binding protein [Burkholderia cepacia]UQO50258.1 ATP-binding protein [Burkholderia cepacia]UQP04424.1 ATP-binding protein [Burkholderia cepacia]